MTVLLCVVVVVVVMAVVMARGVGSTLDEEADDSDRQVPSDG